MDIRVDRDEQGHTSAASPRPSPETAYEQHWALALLDRALERGAGTAECARVRSRRSGSARLARTSDLASLAPREPAARGGAATGTAP